MTDEHLANDNMNATALTIDSFIKHIHYCTKVIIAVVPKVFCW